MFLRPLLAGLALCLTAQATPMGALTLPADEVGEAVTVFYPAAEPARPVQRGVFELELAPDAAPLPGNGRLVVVSHGSGGNPWVNAEVSQALVNAGFVVALPRHRGDSTRDGGHPGPESWKLRPAEMSRAIDRVAADPRFAGLRLDRVGAYGMSAGGHTALSLAGGAWSPERFRAHCEQHLAEDFNACVGLATRLSGGWLDGFKLWLARRVLNSRFGEATPQTYDDPRFAAIVAGVPAAADFDPASLARPRVPLGLVTVGRDRWLPARWHSDAILAACQTCEHLADLPDAGHGALLAPPPPPGVLGALECDLICDPEGFDRAAATPRWIVPTVDFFRRHLLSGAAP
ncbi:alpha/beta hydrolase family protein [Roseateles saccharophilus]|uniref:Putative dienelactone hydrolase n=1 Tax=Roseateles saccharophilus TaxID=304 RepID=A0A4R3V5S6_ROSSA|nr:dienelactone hydrolase [Roseateles saccharophilus]MDG0831428.1 dienelactone hydrolase [Roseateles saccharophilus]TCU98688.1 putative dienelactone hydrolase [Roseateles saccharophilus]